MTKGFKAENTNYDGVTFIVGKDPRGKDEKIYYIRYRLKGKRYHESVGRQRRDKMNAFRASRIRSSRISGTELPKVEQRIEEEKRKKAEERKVTFRDYANEWFERGKGRKKEWSKSTKNDYKSALRLYLIPALGDIPLVDLTYRDISDFLDNLPELSGKRKNNIMVPLKALLNYAVKLGDIPVNPAEGIERQEEDPTDIDPLSFPEMKTFLDTVDPHYSAYFATAFLSGMRPNELIALKWRNMDLTMRLIYIREGRVLGVEGPPKTLSSNRDVDITQPLYEILQKHRDTNYIGNDNAYVFTTKEGNPLEVNNLRKRVWYPTLQKAGLRERTMQQHRHTFASLMLSKGEDQLYVAKTLGHTSLQMLHKHYAKYIRSRDRIDGQKFVAGYEAAKALPEKGR